MKGHLHGTQCANNGCRQVDRRQAMTDEPVNDAENVQNAVRAGLIDHDDVHCEHGTFIGTKYGPDYLCGQCENDDD